MKYQSVLSAVVLSAVAANALTSITIKGNAFYSGNDRFYIRGVDYQPGGSSNVSDPLADEDGCKRDVPVFKSLGLNAIRVYTVDNSADHDACMKLLDDAGIYLVLDVNTPKQSINRADPSASYNAPYLQAIFATIDAFKNYENVLGFFSANEVINDVNSTGVAPYVKAVTRDMKKYIKNQSKRQIPVGYSAADISQNRWQQMEYFNCGDDDETIDMFGMNDYSWCGESSFTVSGYSQNVENYGNYSIPMFFSEYGCNKVTPRKFTEVGTIYSDKMSGVYSGGLVYEYSQEPNNYGLVKVSTGSDSVEYLTDFYNLKYALGNATDPSGDAGASTSRSKANCPSYEEGVWEVKDNTIPDTPSGAEDYFKNGAGKPLGFNAPSTQWSSSDTGNSSDSSSSSSSSSSGSSSSSAAASSASATSSKSKAGSGALEAPAGLNTLYSLVLGVLAAAIAL